ncbi:RRP15-like protein isoform X2 [Antennarius striatus]|uniref:RRP15-like protein isoform X2 n=1 Tax=Antennarius striatus TaxID=241820 RepID=UPI0035AE7C73
MMACLLQTHVQMSDDSEPQFEGDPDQQDSVKASSDERSDDDSEGGINDSDHDEDGGQDEGGQDGAADTGWAEAMAKILGKKVSESKTTILVKNRELDKIKEKEQQQLLEKKKQVDRKRAWEMMCREKPDVVKDRENERALQRIATRGVVQLFNAVRKHQKTINDKVKEVGGSERKKAKLLSCVSKKDFIDVLRQADGGNKTEKKTAAAAEETPPWSVLRDDYMMGASMKDWDKHSDEEEAGTQSKGVLEESDSD